MIPSPYINDQNIQWKSYRHLALSLRLQVACIWDQLFLVYTIMLKNNRTSHNFPTFLMFSTHTSAHSRFHTNKRELKKAVSFVQNKQELNSSSRREEIGIYWRITALPFVLNIVNHWIAASFYIPTRKNGEMSLALIIAQSSLYGPSIMSSQHRLQDLQDNVLIACGSWYRVSIQFNTSGCLATRLAKVPYPKLVTSKCGRGERKSADYSTWGSATIPFWRFTVPCSIPGSWPSFMLRHRGYSDSQTARWIHLVS